MPVESFMRHLKIILITSVLLFSLSNSASGLSEVTLNDIRKPGGAVLFIVDGLGSSYFYPEFTPYALDGNELSKARTRNLTFGSRIIDIRTHHPVTGIAHSVIVTGYSEANEEIVGYPDATIYDITRQYGFVNIAVMEKGDFMNMREEQDIILFAENNSINKPLVSIQAQKAPSGVFELMYEWKMRLPAYLNNRSGVERYSAYNKWGIDAAASVVKFMIEKHPDRKFLLTVNVGAVDSGGHNLGEDDYIRLIEDIDRDLYSLYDAAEENDIALFFTADHGMSFAKKDARRGGHSSRKYSSRQESLRIPFEILSPNVNGGVVDGEYGQEDIAPTILSVLDLPDTLQYADGEALNIKSYASIFVDTDTEYNVSLWNNGVRMTGGSDSELIFSGLPLNSSYRIEASGSGGEYDEELFLDSDKQFSLRNVESGASKREMTAVILILVVIVTGTGIIMRIKD